MSILVIRHAISEANNRDNIGTLAFGAKNAPLMKTLAPEQIRRCKKELWDTYAINTTRVAVATSELERTKETARGLGFRKLHPNALLNEVEHGLEREVFKQMKHARQLPPAAIKAAEAILANPPVEKVWVAHGLVIAGLCHVLRPRLQHTFEHFIPRFCEIRALPI